MWPKDILTSTLNPKPSGNRIGDDEVVRGVVGDGMLCMHAAMSQWRPHGEEYEKKIKRVILKSPIALFMYQSLM